MQSSNPDQIELQVSENAKTPSTKKLSPQNDESNPKFQSTYDKAWFISKFNFFFVLPLTFRVWKKNQKDQSITEKDLLTFPHSLRAEVIEKDYSERLENQKKSGKINSVWAVLFSLKWLSFLAIFVQTVFIFLRIFQAYVMKRLIECYLDPVQATSDAYWWAAILVGVMALAFYGDHHWNDITSRLSAHARAGIISMLYNKITRLSSYSITKLSAGQLVNLAANDVNTIEMLGFFFPSIITGWITIIAGTAYFWTEYGVVCLLGIGYILATIPLQAVIAHLSSKPRSAKNALTDERVRKTAEIIQDIRLLKMYTWENKFRQMIDIIRKKDISVSNKVLVWESISRAIANTCQYMAAFLIFMLYYVTGGELTIAKVFSTYFLLAFIRFFGGYFVYNSFIFIAEARLFFQRVDKVLEAPEIGEIKFESPQDSKNAIEFANFSGYWTKDNEKAVTKPQESLATEQNNLTSPKDAKATLVNLDLNIQKGSMNAVVGTIGSGKTSLLLSFTGEMPLTTGQLRYKGTIAYVEQEPSIFAGTFRECILFGREYKEDFYNKVIKACSLESDLKLFPHGDMSMIGERGNNLSGGQKARLALARAVYADADIYLLDDPLSAVDAKVAKSIYNETIVGLLKEKTVILATHQVHFIKEVKNIIVMDGGQILGNGSFEQLKEQGIDVDKIFSTDKSKKNSIHEIRQSEKKVQEGENLNAKNDENANEAFDEDGNQDAKENPPPPVAENDPHGGEVKFKTYVLLFKEVGLFFSFVIFFFYLMAQFGEVAFGRILGAWTAGQFNLGESLGTLGGLAIYLLVFHIIRNVLLTFGLFGASCRYHDKMLDKVMRSPVSFFDTNPVGRILNRFANDIGILDKFFPQIFLDVFDIFSSVITVTITLAIIDPLLLAPLAGCLILIVFVVIFFYPTLKQTKSFDLGSRGPLFSLYSATISGIAIIRSYRQTDFIKNKFTEMLYTNTKGNINFCFSSRLLGFCVDLIYTLGAFGMIYIITARIDPENGASSGAIAGFCLALLSGLTGAFQHGVRQFCQTNVLMASTARVQAYSNLPVEAPLVVSQDKEHKDKNWPQGGKIEFEKVFMKYRPDADFVIKDLNLQVKAGEKIGCVGRTGAGKSTIIGLLFRLQEIDRSGANATESSIKIDDVNTQPLGLHLLRGNISIIPQTPFIFTGSIKQNLDPLGQFTDQQVWDVLGEVRLKDHVAQLKDKLETNVSNASSVFSVGQKQLICLARALLKPCKVLVLDEATANMDTEVDTFIQKKIMEKFASATVFTIAHRLVTIANYDKVLVLDKGRRVEFDEPYKLLVQNVGDNQVTNTTGHFGSMVMNTGPKASQIILNIAKETYEKKHGKL